MSKGCCCHCTGTEKHTDMHQSKPTHKTDTLKNKEELPVKENGDYSSTLEKQQEQEDYQPKK